MAWFWRGEAGPEAPGPDVLDDTGLATGFESQAAAEGWLTSAYAELAEQGVRAVSLYEEDRLVYGPMSLDAD